MTKTTELSRTLVCALCCVILGLVSPIDVCAAEPIERRGAFSEDVEAALDRQTQFDALVVFFSPDGDKENAKGYPEIVADMVAQLVRADRFRIAPLEPYSQESTKTPGYVSDVKKWDSYDPVYFVFPLWNGDLPSICEKFIDDHDWTGKTIVPIDTYSSPIPKKDDKTEKTFKRKCKGTLILKKLSVSEDDLKRQPQKAADKIERRLQDLVY